MRALKKTTTKDDGGLYVDAVHKVTALKLSAIGDRLELGVRLSMYRDESTAEDGGLSAQDSHYVIDASSPAVASALDALTEAVYGAIRSHDDHMADAVDVRTAPRSPRDRRP